MPYSWQNDSSQSGFGLLPSLNVIKQSGFQVKETNKRKDIISASQTMVRDYSILEFSRAAGGRVREGSCVLCGYFVM